MSEGFICRHCGKSQELGRARGLCSTCYLTPEIRDLYPPATEGSGRRGIGLNPPDKSAKDVTPTKYPPGSAGKAKIMAERVEAGLPIFCDDDAADWQDATPESEGPMQLSDNRFDQEQLVDLDDYINSLSEGDRRNLLWMMKTMGVKRLRRLRDEAPDEQKRKFLEAAVMLKNIGEAAQKMQQ